MNEYETSQILQMLYAEIGKPLPPPKVKIWASVLGPVPFALGLKAAQEMILKTRVYGEPQLADYREHVNRLHREARQALKPRQGFDPARLANMSAEERDALQARIAPPKMNTAEARAILEAVDLHLKSVPGRKTIAQKERERDRQRQMIEGLRDEAQRQQVILLGPEEQEPERKPFLPVREPVPLKTEDEFEQERQRQKRLAAELMNNQEGA